jgi:hypothetical protein
VRGEGRDEAALPRAAGRGFSFVMAGLVPAIRAFPIVTTAKTVDAQR